jgi:hypothetical protein
MAGINADSLAETALDRSFIVEMTRKGITTKKSKYRDGSAEEVCSPLRDELYHWALQRSQRIASEYESDDLDEPASSIG